MDNEELIPEEELVAPNEDSQMTVSNSGVSHNNLRNGPSAHADPAGQASIEFRPGPESPDGEIWRIGAGGLGGSLPTEFVIWNKEHGIVARFNKDGTTTGEEKYLPLDGSKSMMGWINFGADQSGLVFYGMGRIYKKDGGGMILRKSSGNQQWKVQNNDGGGEVAIATVDDIPDAYTKTASDERYALKSEIPEAPPATASAIVGDVKSGFQPEDHSGWIKLDGRPISNLSSEAQKQAAIGLGFTESLPNASGAILMQGGALGAVSGSMERTIAQENLPEADLESDSSGDHYHAMMAVTNENGNCGLSDMLANGAYPATKVWNRQAGVATGNNQNIPIVGKAMENSGPHSHKVALGGSGKPLDITPKTLGVNKFVYLGEAVVNG